MGGTNLFLAAVLVVQFPGPTRADLEFICAVEDFARSTPPAAWAARIAALGAHRYHERETASGSLEAAVRSDPGSVRWLLVGRRHRDPEVGIRCNAILRRLYPCGACMGSRHSRNWVDWPCDDCGGTGTEWPYGAWDD